jgi:hypothetical protein
MFRFWRTFRRARRYGFTLYNAILVAKAHSR